MSTARPGSPVPRLLLAAALLAAAATASPAGEGEDPSPASMAETVLDGRAGDADRAAAAASLSRADPVALGDALLESARRKRAADLPFLLEAALAEEARPLRLLAVNAAGKAAPGKAAAAFLERAGDPDEKRALRALEAAGFLAAASRDRAKVLSRLHALARGPRLLPSLEAVRALGRIVDGEGEKALVEAVVDAEDPHVRKHLCWTLLDLAGERKAPKLLDPFLKGPGERPARAGAAQRVFRDGGEPAWDWRPEGLDALPALWEERRAEGWKVEVVAAGGGPREKILSFLAELDAREPAWANLVRLAARQVAVMPLRAETVFEPRTRTLYLAPYEMDAAEKPWQGAYVLARNASVALGVHLGEPDAGHRSWEHACIEVHSFLRTAGHENAPLGPFVEKTLGKLVHH